MTPKTTRRALCLGWVIGISGMIACSTVAPSHHVRTPASDADPLALPMDEPFGADPRGIQPGTSVYRVESVGGTELQLDLSGSGATFDVSVDGPWSDLAGNATPANSQETMAQTSGDGEAQLDVVLGPPGVYHVTIHTSGSDGFQGSAKCVASCARPSVAVSAWMAEIQAAGKMPAFEQFIQSLLNKYVTDPALRAELGTQLTGILESANFAALDRFPLLNIQQIGKLRAALSPSEQALVASSEKKSAAPPSVVHGDLSQILGACSSARPLSDPISPSFPGVRYGDYNNMGLSDCQYTQSGTLANLLTSLASGNGSSVTFEGATLQSPSDLIGALIGSGHRVEMRNEKVFANFLSFTLGDPNDPAARTLKWPVWLDTGIVLKNRAHLVIPMGHSQHTWLISGPLLNARVTYFLGIYGTGFFANTSVRAPWTGLRTAYRYDSAKASDQSKILQALDTSAVYFKRNATEATTVAKGLPADGYGYLGVCNDSTALLEAAYRDSDTSYPLVRAKSLSSNPLVTQIDDGLGSMLDQLPHDADNIPDIRTAAGRENVLKRIVWMLPYSVDSANMINESLRATYKELLAEKPELRSLVPR